MRRNIIGFVAWAVAYGAALWMNLGSFWMGDGAAAGQLGITVLYAAVCLFLLWLTRNSCRWVRHGFFWGIMAVLGGGFCLLAREGVPWAAIPGLILGGALFTPFYGLTYLVILEDWDVFYGTMLGLSVFWTAVSACLLLRVRGQKNGRESE